MKTNYNTTITGNSCMLVPYRREHVELYHQWMQVRVVVVVVVLAKWPFKSVQLTQQASACLLTRGVCIILCTCWRGFSSPPPCSSLIELC